MIRAFHVLFFGEKKLTTNSISLVTKIILAMLILQYFIYNINLKHNSSLIKFIYQMLFIASQCRYLIRNGPDFVQKLLTYVSDIC